MEAFHVLFIANFLFVPLVLHSVLCIRLKCPEQCECREESVPKLGISALTTYCDVNAMKSARSWTENTSVLVVNCKGDSFDPSSLEPQLFQKLYALTSLIFSQCDFHHQNKEYSTNFNYSEELYISEAVNFKLHLAMFQLFGHVRSLKIVKSNWTRSSHDSLCVLKDIRKLFLIRNGIRNFYEILELCSQNQSVFNQLTDFTCDFNEIEIITSGSFKTFQNLRSLTLTGNKIEAIQNGSIVNLPQLKVLDISQNYLQTLPNDFGSNCPQLEYLKLSNNPIKEIPHTIMKRFSNLTLVHATNTLLGNISSFISMPLKFLDARNISLRWIFSPLCGNYSHLQGLILGQNQIRVIPTDVFAQCSFLSLLDLSNNNIANLHRKSFHGLKSLTTLYLDMNKIDFISHRTFTSLSNLLRLNLSSNLLKAMPALPKSIFEIDLSKNKIKYIVFDFDMQYHMKTLNLGYNRIQTLENYRFLKCHALSSLQLNNNMIKTLQQFAFYGLTHLNKLDITYNKIENVNTVLRFCVNLRELHAKHNFLSILNENMFPESIQEINLSNNKITTIEEGTFENLKYLKNVDLRWNELVRLDSSSMRINPNIMTVTNFTVFGNPLKCDCHLASLKNNSLNKYPIFLDLAPSECLQDDIHYLEATSPNSRQQQQFACGYKSNSLFTLPFSCYLNCQCCLTENCLCQKKCAASCICKFRYDLKEFRVDCKNRNLTDGTDIPQAAILVDLSANKFGYLTNESFIRPTMAEILYLNHSKITGIGAETFVRFNNLKVLYLDYNEIRILDSSVLLGLRNLTKLILNHNNIEGILPGTFNVTPSLELLDLSHNSLKKIDSETFNIDKLKSILLFDNPWSCECEDINSLSDILINRLSQIYSQNIFCNHSEITVIQADIRFCRNKSLNEISPVLPRKKPVSVYSSSISLVFILLVFMFGAFLYLHRIEIQILLFVRFGWRILSRKNQLDEKDKKYDAFVSYHNSQDAFVVNEMLPRLEKNTSPAYKLCVHFRDFPVGAPIVDNIIESIENSKRTILLLTNEFLTSEWCRYEFQAAHLESLSNKLNNLIVVLLEDVNPDLVDGGLKLYMKTRTYLRYDDPRFWDKLLFALPENKET